MIRIRSFQSRVFAVLLLMAVVPAALALAAGALALAEAGATVGTLGPWDAVAASGRTLADEAVRAAPDDSAVVRAAAAHRDALSSSLQRSRLWALVSSRVRTLLPLAALLVATVLAGLALVAARWLSRSLARPIHEVVGWTQRIGRGEPLPAPGPGAADGGVEEFAELRGALRSMADELAEARDREIESARLRAWTEMARRVAHELKNPLTPMRMAASSLARSDDPAASAPAEVLLEEIARLDDMARTFSQFGRMPEGPRAEVDLGELAQAVVARHVGPGGAGPTDGSGTPHAAARVRAVVDPGVPRVLGHYEVLVRAVDNLVANALEASSEDASTGESYAGADAGEVGIAGGVVIAGEVVIAVELSDPDGSQVADDAKAGAEVRTRDAVRAPDEVHAPQEVRLVVRDRGPGIPEDLLGAMWMPDVTTKRKGTGLGLAIVRQAAEAHGGRTVAANRPDGGAEVGMVLPVRPAEESASPASGESAAPAAEEAPWTS